MQPTREKILDAVFELVYVYGYNGTSMSMILKKCEIPKGSLYHYFKSKKEMVLVVIEERLAPSMNAFYDFTNDGNKHPLDVLIDAINKVATKKQLVLYGCPLNRLNQEMSPIDKDFEAAITIIYKHMRAKIIILLGGANLQTNTNILAEFVIATVWGALSLSPAQSSEERYLDTVTPLINYLITLK
ncbi:TetR/AcrR family transcriptional regulator [Sulfurimonas sp.]|uniref:TetR/AcrR family transcriptional regulator n=1 Tax=Sulfurimonas sp. TaxID=2022749 RepID=UPI00262DD5D6|nr:TetR/AcrR family transcriptional regulator [Sulfurimonas sp.]